MVLDNYITVLIEDYTIKKTQIFNFSDNNIAQFSLTKVVITIKTVSTFYLVQGSYQKYIKLRLALCKQGTDKNCLHSD